MWNVVGSLKIFWEMRFNVNIGGSYVNDQVQLGLIYEDCAEEEWI